MIFTIQNDLLNVNVSNLGAELQNIIKRSNSQEYLWQGDPSHWARRSPILFPIVGALKDGYFTIDNNVFRMSQHGFARDMQFNLTEKTDDTLVFELVSNEETKANYPFDFSLSIHYALNERQLFTQYTVRNTGAKILPFSIGAHPAFNCPLLPNERRNEYSLLFEKSETLDRHLLVSGIRSGETRPLLEDENVLAISDNLFDEDALVFTNLRSNSITIQKEETPFLTMYFKGFPYYGIWSKSSSSPFVCLEPWYGIADHSSHNNVLAEKEGIIKLDEGELFQCDYTLTVH